MSIVFIHGDRLGVQKKESKYKNRRVVCDGITFASKKEAWRYEELRRLERAGKIKNLELQKRFYFPIPGASDGARLCYENGRPLAYVADFVYEDVNTGEIVIEDAKGFKTREYAIKKILMRCLNGIKITEV